MTRACRHGQRAHCAWWLRHWYTDPVGLYWLPVITLAALLGSLLQAWVLLIEVLRLSSATWYPDDREPGEFSLDVTGAEPSTQRPERRPEQSAVGASVHSAATSVTISGSAGGVSLPVPPLADAGGQDVAVERAAPRCWVGRLAGSQVEIGLADASPPAVLRAGIAGRQPGLQRPALADWPRRDQAGDVFQAHPDALDLADERQLIQRGLIEHPVAVGCPPQAACARARNAPGARS